MYHRRPKEACQTSPSSRNREVRAGGGGLIALLDETEARSRSLELVIGELTIQEVFDDTYSVEVNASTATNGDQLRRKYIVHKKDVGDGAADYVSCTLHVLLLACLLVSVWR